MGLPIFPPIIFPPGLLNPSDGNIIVSDPNSDGGTSGGASPVTSGAQVENPMITIKYQNTDPDNFEIVERISRQNNATALQLMFEREHYVFKHWYYYHREDRTFLKHIITPGNRIPNAYDGMMLYAQWEWGENYLAYGAGSIVDSAEKGFFRLYDAPTLRTEGERHEFADLYATIDFESIDRIKRPVNALQGFGGSGPNGSKLNRNGGSTYGGLTSDDMDWDEGTLLYNGINRYCIALGPKLQDPDFTVDKKAPGGINAARMAYGTCVDVEIELNSKKYYIPAIIVDVKAHTNPGGIFQSDVTFLDEYQNEIEPGEPNGNIVEWFTNQHLDTPSLNRSTGLNAFTENGAIIIYREEVMA